MIAFLCCTLMVAAALCAAPSNECSALDALPWQQLDDAARDQWQQLDQRVRAQVSTNMASMRRTAETCDVLLRRIANPRDPLDHIDRYDNALSIPGLARELYDRAYALIWQRDYARAYRLFELLSSAMNPDGFARGNAIYFLGHIQYFELHEPMAAFTNLLRGQQFPACLVFTAHAYLHAASIMADINMPIHALALLAVDVPCIDFNQLAYTRHLRSAWLRISLHDSTTAVRHLQAALRAQPKQTNEIVVQVSMVPHGTSIWDAVATSYWCKADVLDTIEWAVTNRCDTPDDRLFLDALLHDWPAQAAVPPAIATNRVLNNNVFPRATRRLSFTPFTPAGD
jgi:hypothetical protein